MNSLPITYLVLTKDSPSVSGLLQYLTDHKDNEDDIVVLDDFSSATNVSIYNQYPIKLVQHKLDGDYSEHRNYALKHLKGRYCVALDDDEMPSEMLMKIIKIFLIQHNLPDLVLVPRRNIFAGVLPIHSLKYNWDVTDGNVINWMRGDYQTRIFKTKRGLKWKGELHERIIPNEEHRVMLLPKDESVCILHHKTITEQIADNERYNLNWSAELNKLGGSYG